MGILPYTAMTYGLTAVISLLVVAIIAAIVFAVRAGAEPGSASNSASGAADDSSYDAEAGKVNKEEFTGTILPETEDAGQEYIDETLFLGDSNTVRYMMYSASDNSKVAFTSLENNIGVTSMGVTSITSLKCEEFQGYSDKVTMPEAVKILQPKRVIIGFGTNNLTMDTDTFISNYKKGLKAIHDAYPYADIIVNAIPPLDKERENVEQTHEVYTSFRFAAPGTPFADKRTDFLSFYYTAFELIVL